MAKAPEMRDRLLRRFGAPVLQLRHLVPQGAGNSPEVAAGPVNPVAAGAFAEPAVVQEDMLRNPALDLVPVEGGEEIVAMAATGQGLEVAGREAQTLEHFLKLAFRVRRGQHHKVGPFQAVSGCLPGQDVGPGPGGRPAPGRVQGQAHEGGVEAAETQPLGQSRPGADPPGISWS